MKIEQYVANRRYWDVAIVLSMLSVSFATTLGVELIERGRYGGDLDVTIPLILETTSHIAIALAIPLLLLFDRLVPIRAASWLRALAAHAVFSIIFSLTHVLLMYWARIFAFTAIDGSTYRWSNWLGEFGYEYLKDFRTYFLILALVYLYRFIIRRLQGEAGFLSEEKDEKMVAGLSDRFLVKKFGREFLVRIDEIDWIESCGNYVNIHVGDRIYPLRETMTRIDDRLVQVGFQRVHRCAGTHQQALSPAAQRTTFLSLFDPKLSILLATNNWRN